LQKGVIEVSALRPKRSKDVISHVGTTYHAKLMTTFRDGGKHNVDERIPIRQQLIAMEIDHRGDQLNVNLGLVMAHSNLNARLGQHCDSASLLPYASKRSTKWSATARWHNVQRLAPAS
jgi:hypothetical protein